MLDNLSFFYPEVLLAQHSLLGRVTHSHLTRVYGEARVQVLHCLSRCVLLEGGGGSEGSGAFRVELSVDTLQLVSASISSQVYRRNDGGSQVIAAVK